MKVDEIVNREERYVLGFDSELEKYYVSFPVSNHLVDYEEYYEISQSFFEGYPENQREMLEYVKVCRARQNDSKLMFKPGSNRGYPC